MNANIESAEKKIRGRVQQIPGVDATLEKSGAAADAKAVGERLLALQHTLDTIQDEIAALKEEDEHLLENDVTITNAHNQLNARVGKIGGELTTAGSVYLTGDQQDKPADRYGGNWMQMGTNTTLCTGMTVYIWMCIAPSSG